MPAGVSTRIAGIGRATAASSGGVQAGPPQRRDRGRRGEHAAGPPVPGGRALEDDDRRGRPRRGGPRATAPAGPPPTIATPDPLARSSARPRSGPAAPSGSRAVAGGSRRDGRDRVALAERAADRPDRRSARPSRSSAAISPAGTTRRTDSGASWRVYRLPVRRWPISQAPIQPSRAAIEVVDDDPEPRDPGHLAEQARRPRRRSGGGAPARRGRRRTSGRGRAATGRRRRGARGRASPRPSGRGERGRGQDLGPAVDGRRSTSRATARAARARSAIGMSAPPVPTSSRVSSGRWAASASMAPAVRRTPPSQRLTRRRSRRLPASAAGSSSGPSSSSTASVRRSIAAGYPRDRPDAHGSARAPGRGARVGRPFGERVP